MHSLVVRVSLLLLLTLGMVDPSWAIPAFVKAGTSSGSAGTTHTVTLANVSAGNTIACFIQIGGTGQTINSFSDDSGSNTWSSVLNATSANSRISGQAYAENVAASTSLVITATLSGSNNGYMVCHEISGVLTSGALDQSTIQGQAAVGTGTDAITSGDVTTTTDGQYIFSATAKNSTTAATYTAGTNESFTIQGNATNSNVRWAAEYAIQTTAGITAGKWTTTLGTDNHHTGIMTFKAAGGGGGGATPRNLMLMGVGP